MDDSKGIRRVNDAAILNRLLLPRLPSAAGIGVPAALLLLFIAVPLAALFWRAAASPDFWASLRAPVVLDALRLTALTTAVTLAVVLVCGTPLAFLLARRSFRGKTIVEILVDLPLILPPVVAGLALLIAFDRRGLLGQQLGLFRIELPFTTAAVVLAQLFVAGPFYIRGAQIGFRAIDAAVEEAAVIDGASTWASFRHVTFPLAMPGIMGGAALCLGRAVSEFGATLLFAGNLQGRTQTMSLAIVQAMQTDLSGALALAVLLLAASGTVLIASRALLSGRLTFS